MNHDLFLRPAPGREPLHFDEVQERLRDHERFARLLNEAESTPELLVLADPDTSVVLTLAPGGPPPEGPPEPEPEEAAAAGEGEGEEGEDEAEEPEPEEPEDDGTLHLQLPYVRPRCFAVEGAAIAAELARTLGYELQDPLAGPGPASEAAIVASWEEQNRALLAELATPTPEAPTGGDLPTPVDSKLLEAVFAHNRGRRALREAAKNVELPRLALAAIPLRKEPAVVCRHTAGEAVWLPTLATHVVLTRKKKGFLGYKDEEVLVEADALRALLAPGEKPGVAPPGLTAYDAILPATSPAFAALPGTPAKGLAVYPWPALTEAPAAP